MRMFGVEGANEQGSGPKTARWAWVPSWRVMLRRADCVCKSILAELKGAIAVRHACVDRGVQEHLRKIVRRHSRAQRSANLHV